MDNSCNSLTTLSILKFIIKSINNDIPDIKLIFIGPQIDKTKTILNKIENKEIKIKGEKDDLKDSAQDPKQDPKQYPEEDHDHKYMHTILSSSENKYLEKTLPYYITKFGNISKYTVFFIYKYIEENLPIEHVRIILYETIKEYVIPKTNQNDSLYLPYNMLIYKYPKTMTFKYFIEQIILILLNISVWNVKVFGQHMLRT